MSTLSAYHPPMTAREQVSPARIWWHRVLHGPSAQDRILVYEELRSLANAGIGIQDALESVAGRASGPRATAFGAVAAEVRAGAEPGAAFLAHPESFPPVEAALIRAGERTGRYDTAFTEAAAEAERERAAFAMFVKQIRYPFFLVHFGMLVPLPLVMKIQAGGDWSTWIVVSLVILAAMWACGVAALTHHANRIADPLWGRRIAHLPWAGNAIRSAAVARFAGATAALFDAGVSLPDAVETGAECAGNGWLREDAVAAASAMRQGASASETLGRIYALPTEASPLIATGDRSGTLADAFRRIAQLERDRAAAALGRTARGIHAIIFVLVSLGVAWMFLTVVGGYYETAMSIK